MREDWLKANPGKSTAILTTQLKDTQKLLESDIYKAIKYLSPKTVISSGKGSGGASLAEYVVRTMYETGFFGRKMHWYGVPAKELKGVLMEEMKPL